jgi:hypothetical protein
LVLGGQRHEYSRELFRWLMLGADGARRICAAPRGPYGLATAATSGIPPIWRSTPLIRSMAAASSQAHVS